MRPVHQILYVADSVSLGQRVISEECWLRCFISRSAFGFMYIIFFCLYNKDIKRIPLSQKWHFFFSCDVLLSPHFSAKTDHFEGYVSLSTLGAKKFGPTKNPFTPEIWQMGPFGSSCLPCDLKLPVTIIDVFLFSPLPEAWSELKLPLEFPVKATHLFVGQSTDSTLIGHCLQLFSGKEIASNYTPWWALTSMHTTSANIYRLSIMR